MPDFSIRSYEKELLDRTDIPFTDIKRNMQELEIINTRLGGHQITITGLKKIADNLKVIDKWCRKNNISVKLIGIDINKDCIEYAKENCRSLANKHFIVSDY